MQDNLQAPVSKVAFCQLQHSGSLRVCPAAHRRAPPHSAGEYWRHPGFLSKHKEAGDSPPSRDGAAEGPIKAGGTSGRPLGLSEEKEGADSWSSGTAGDGSLERRTSALSPISFVKEGPSSLSLPAA